MKVAVNDKQIAQNVLRASLAKNEILVSAVNLGQGANQAAHVSPRSSYGVWQAAAVYSYIQNKSFSVGNWSMRQHEIVHSIPANFMPLLSATLALHKRKLSCEILYG
jgi:hypothetical protein